MQKQKCVEMQVLKWPPDARCILQSTQKVPNEKLSISFTKFGSIFYFVSDI